MPNDRAEPSAEATNAAQVALQKGLAANQANGSTPYSAPQTTAKPIAREVDAFAAQAVQRERERCHRLLLMWDARSDRFSDVLYDLTTLRTLLIQHVVNGYEP